MLEGITLLCEAFTKMPNLTSVSLNDNQLCGLNQFGDGTFTLEGLTLLCEAFTKTPKLTSVSVDGHPLPVDQLKGTIPTESIDFSGKSLGVASAIIIALCIAGNEHLKQ